MVLNDISHGLANVLDPTILALMVFGVLLGILMGSIPGMTATMTIAVLLSFTFTLEPATGMMLLLGIFGGAVYAGSIPAILIRTPGTPSAAATIFDGYPLSQKGEAGRAIRMSTVASFIGGFISVLALMFLSPLIADAALRFRSPEFFALALFGLTIIASVSGDSLTKGMISGLLGMLIATVGIDPLTGYQRFTFDVPNLMGGIEFIAVMIGLFGIAEGLRKYAQGIDDDQNQINQKITGVLPSLSDIKSIAPISIVSGFIGSLVGAIPGAGGDIASFITYNEATRWLKDTTPSFGEGNIRGVAAAESGNNASTGGALIPTFTLGIPGDSVSALLIGALMVHNVTPGPELYQDESGLLYTIFVGFLLIYVIILIFGLLGANYWARLINIPQNYVWPVIFVLCVIGAIALSGTVFNAWVMLAAGGLGFVMRFRGYPLAPMVLGLILAPIAEANLRRSLDISGGSLDIFYTSPIALTVILLSIATVAVPAIRSVRD
ncbi:tripartite tricarboxylate transporter permease [Halostagnicola sp. A-GB9-2]|uniref:tripartite tricarboxylate transporter permease n=1 Tax=Halostagnicola sp. A-GB9-2 TaxID=3048066 RepID=UPI0024BFAEEF|nr:tripartite tricarboxylate transporter permease [Halostagnicola sp. A-GB9-2]MDJ1433686.1 tripartite tricarboxylate transporter permease [Halostagnicola sp. A-GB9-2]